MRRSGPSLRIERDPSMAETPYIFDFNEALYEELLRDDLGFTDESIDALSIKATDARTIRPHALGYYNYLTKRIVLKPGYIWRMYPYAELATRTIGSNLRHESKHAAQHLIEGMNPLSAGRLAASVAVRGISVALALGEHHLLNQPGFDYSDVAAVGTYAVLNHTGHRLMYRHDSREVDARAFQHEAAIQEKWAGVVSLTPAT